MRTNSFTALAAAGAACMFTVGAIADKGKAPTTEDVFKQTGAAGVAVDSGVSIEEQYLQTHGEAAGAGIEALTTIRVADPTQGLIRPVGVYYAPDDFTRIFIVEKRGYIKILNTKTGVLQSSADPFLNIDSIVGGGTSQENEQGLLGLAFHPDYQNNGFFYVYHTTNTGAVRIARYTRMDPDHADTTSGFNIMGNIPQPQGNHNGGWIGFSPNDGYLYIATGDGGNFCDTGTGHVAGGNAQDITNNLLGKMLRVDVDGDDFPGDANNNYAIPSDNPFVGVTGDDEIFAYGLRNPWRAGFDRVTGDLYIGDVGQGAREEISFIAGDETEALNFGWVRREGLLSSASSGCPGGGALLPTDTQPIWDYNRLGGRCTVIGGYVYRGCAIPSLDGNYFFADYRCSTAVPSPIYTLEYDGSVVSNHTDRTAELDPGGGLSIRNVTSFGEDARGEIYICDQAGGEVFKIVPVTPTIAPEDIDCSGTVDVFDLLEALDNFGPCDGCAADLNGDHTVDVFELLDILDGWTG